MKKLIKDNLKSIRGFVGQVSRIVIPVIQAVLVKIILGFLDF